MRPQAIITIVLFIIITAAVIWWVMPDKSNRAGNNNPPTQSVTLTATNEKGEAFTVHLGGMIVNGTNAPITNGNISFTVATNAN